jgi:prepilin-type N-terminal cleavage/methylation domain-containing protein
VQGQRAHPRYFERQSPVFPPAVKLERGTLFTDHDSTAQLMRVAALRRAVVPRLRDVRGFTLPKQRERTRAFTLIELLVVVGIIGLLLVLIAPAFTTIKGGTDVTSAAYTIQGVLDTARTYAKANNTYTWVGFAGSIGATTTGQVQMAIVASKDGTNLWSANNALPATSLVQVGKMITLNNVHIGDTGAPLNDGTEFESRASVDSDHRISSSANTPYPFTVQQTTFDKWIQFSPRGDTLVHGGNFSIVRYAEVGLLPTHGTTLAATINPASGNVVAIQVSGFGGNARIYRR